MTTAIASSAAANTSRCRLGARGATGAAATGRAATTAGTGTGAGIGAGPVAPRTLGREPVGFRTPNACSSATHRARSPRVEAYAQRVWNRARRACSASAEGQRRATSGSSAHITMSSSSRG